MIYAIPLQPERIQQNMRTKDDSIPLSVSLNGFYRKALARRNSPVNKRVLYLSLQVTANAIIIGLVAKGLVYLIDLITNLSFYGKFSFEAASPAGNHLGALVLLVPIGGAILVGFMARYGSGAIKGHGIPEAMEKIILDESRIPPIITFLKPLRRPYPSVPVVRSARKARSSRPGVLLVR